MLNNRNIQIFFLSVFVALVCINFKFGFSWYYLLLPVIGYLAFNAYGASVIQANYFLQSVCKGPTKTKTICLTFDDGPSGKQTEQILDILKAHHVPAAFFVIGKNIAGNESLLKRMDSEGHVVANHSFSHNFWFSMKSSKDMLADIRECDKAIKNAIGKQPKLFRPPYGVTNPMVAKTVQLGGYSSIGWSLRTFDTTAKSKEQLLKKTLGKINNGDVVLFHDSGPHTIFILGDFINAVRLKGFEFAGLEQLARVKAYL